MTGKTHALSGIILSAAMIIHNAATGTFNPLAAVVIYGSVASGVLAPDIDCATSIKGRRLWFLRPLQKGPSHRNSIMHTAVVPVLLTAMRNYMNMPVLVNMILRYFIIGFFLHIILDTFTADGIRWFYPFFRKKISLRKTRSGHGAETLWGIVISVVFSAAYIAIF